MPAARPPMPDMGLFDFTLRYQRTHGAQYHARPLTLLQQDILYRCNGKVTVADLADATLYTHQEIGAVLNFLARHGLIKTLPAESWLFDFTALPPMNHASPPVQARSRRFRQALKRKLRAWNDRLWYRLTWDVQRRC